MCKYGTCVIGAVSKLFRAYRLYNKLVRYNVCGAKRVSKLFRAYRLYNEVIIMMDECQVVSKLFRAYRLYNAVANSSTAMTAVFQSSFELTGYITIIRAPKTLKEALFQSSFELTGYITVQLIMSQMRK